MRTLAQAEFGSKRSERIRVRNFYVRAEGWKALFYDFSDFVGWDELVGASV